MSNIENPATAPRRQQAAIMRRAAPERLSRTPVALRLPLRTTVELKDFATRHGRSVSAVAAQAITFFLEAVDNDHA